MLLHCALEKLLHFALKRFCFEYFITFCVDFITFYAHITFCVGITFCGVTYLTNYYLPTRSGEKSNYILQCKLCNLIAIMLSFINENKREKKKSQKIEIN